MKRDKIYFLLLFFLCGVVPLCAQDKISLEGEWLFKVDSANVGEQQHWERDAFSQKISLPGSTDEWGIGNEYPLFKSILGTNNLEGYPTDADFGMLTRKHKYLGKAWYQKKFVIPAGAKDKKYTLFLERVMWRSKVWIDGNPVGSPVDYLSTPHIYTVGNLTPGEHSITIQVDNSQIHPIGTLGHAYCPHMQSQWNGIVGEICLLETPRISIEHIAVYPSFKDKNVKTRLELSNDSRKRKVTLHLTVKEKATGNTVAVEKLRPVVEAGSSTVDHTFTIDGSLLPWDEFTPELYQLEVSLDYSGQKQVCTTDFGFRDLGIADKHFTINGRKFIYRNSHEGMFFGKTGYPATDVDYWRKIWKLYKDHGFNAVRFHSSCPPEAAFIAADEVGLYMQVEFFWIDGWMGYKDLIGGNNEALNDFVLREFKQAVKMYGNHPSMMLVSFGNELGGNFEQMGKWIAEVKKDDPRHYYAAGIAHNITSADDYVEYGGKNKAQNYEGTDWDYTHNYTVPKAHNYDATYQRKDLPEFTHETGQYIVHPLWSEIDKYDGVFAPQNLEYFKKRAEENGIVNLDAELQRASGNINKMLYKAEIEATLRTPSSAGYSLLSMVDYPGQGEALVGWVDPFYENKNFMTAEEFRLFGTHTVPLLRFSKYVWEEGERFVGTVEVSNYGKETLKGAQVHYVLKDGDKILENGTLSGKDIEQGGITFIGEFSHLLKTGEHGSQLTVSLDIVGTEYKNSWSIWVFPSVSKEKMSEDVLFTTSLSEALKKLEQGGKVLLQADQLGSVKNRIYAAFNPVFWSATWFVGQKTDVSGAFIRTGHAALDRFPTSDVMDWQWKDVCDGARGFVLNELPKSYYPIVQPVNDFHHGNKLGTIFELKTKEGGKLLVCGYNITDNLDRRPAARQLRASLMHYVSSAAFAPRQLVEREWLEQTLTDMQSVFKEESNTQNALLYVKAGASYTDLGSTKWKPELDMAMKGEGFDYRVVCDGIWQDDNGSFWFGKKMSIEIDVKYPQLMDLKLYFYDSKKQSRRGTIHCEDMPEVVLKEHVKDFFVTIPVTRENCLDGKIVVDIECTSGPNLMIDKVILSSR